MPKQNRTQFVGWMGPLLDVLRELGGSASPREASDAIAEKLQLTPEVRNALTKTGMERFHNQVQWARQYLVWEGYIDAGRRGVWTLTPTGLKASIDYEEGHRIFLKWVAHHTAQRKPKEIRDLRGAMDGRAEKAIFITTGSFSAQAREEAERPGATPIELVDGNKLIGMFELLELGVRPRTIFEIDPAFFDSFKH